MNNFLVYFYPLNRLKPIRVIEPLISCQNRRSLFGSFAFKKNDGPFRLRGLRRRRRISGVRLNVSTDVAANHSEGEE